MYQGKSETNTAVGTRLCEMTHERESSFYFDLPSRSRSFEIPVHFSGRLRCDESQRHTTSVTALDSSGRKLRTSAAPPLRDRLSHEIDLCFQDDGHRKTVEQRRFVLPLPQAIDGGLTQKRITGDNTD